jgi:hypothetical protein
VSAQAGQSGAVAKTSVESTAQDNFQKVKRHKRYISNKTSQATKKSTKPVPTSTAVKLPPKAVLTHNFLAPLRTTDMDMKATGAENTLPESGGPPPIMTTSTTNVIRLQRDLRDQVKGEYEFQNSPMVDYSAT